MRESVDTLTADLLPAHDLAGERIAPLTARERAAIRATRYREKNGVVAMTVNIAPELLAEFNTYLAKTGKRRSDVIAHVLRTQVLRKR